MYCLQWLIPVLLIPKPLPAGLLHNHVVFLVLYLTGFFLERKPCTICSLVFLAAVIVLCYSGYGNCLFWTCADDGSSNMLGCSRGDWRRGLPLTPSDSSSAPGGVRVQCLRGGLGGGVGVTVVWTALMSDNWEACGVCVRRVLRGREGEPLLMLLMRVTPSFAVCWRCTGFYDVINETFAIFTMHFKLIYFVPKSTIQINTTNVSNVIRNCIMLLGRYQDNLLFSFYASYVLLCIFINFNADAEKILLFHRIILCLSYAMSLDFSIGLVI